MAEDEYGMILIVVVALVAVLGLGLSLASVATDESLGRMMGGNGGPMMGSPNTTTASSAPGVFEWGILLVSAIFLVLSVVLLMRSRRARVTSPAAAPRGASLGAPLIAPSPPATVPKVADAVPATPPVGAPVPEPTLVKLLDADERRMYLELRDHGGQMLQRDLVALGIFSKAKVTRVLDKLESKGLVVREAHGMTNRVRLVSQAGK